MRFHFTIAIVLFLYPVTLFSQIGITSGLSRKQPSTAFYPLTYISLEDQEVSGYGFVNPVDYKTIVFISEKPTDSLVKDWKSIKVKSATVYRENFKDFVDQMEDLGLKLDSTDQKKIRSKTNSLSDTLQVYFLRKMKGAIAHGLRQFIYENEEIRLFRFVPSLSFMPPPVIMFQTTELPVYDSETYFISYLSHKAFKRSVKKSLKKCPKMIENAENGKYFPESKEGLLEFAEDYKTYCSN